MINFEELKKQVAEDLELKPETIDQKSIKLSSIYIKYLNVYMGEIRSLKEIQTVKEKTYTQLLHKFRKEGFEGYEIKGKDTDNYIGLDEGYQKIVSSFKEQEFICKYLENVLDQVNKISFSIKNFIEISKLKSGGY